MDKQRTFFDGEIEADNAAKRLARRTDPPTSHEAAQEAVESGRLSRHCQVILERLQLGPTPNYELAAISLKYTSRISDLRKQGHVIKATHVGGVWWYALEN